MTIRAFAEKHRLKISRDECGDEIIQGKRGHLYFDGPMLCLMVIDRPPAMYSSWKRLGGRLWMGDISSGGKGQRVQDVKVIGIPPENAKLAMAMCGAKAKQVMSEARKAVLAKAQQKGLVKFRERREALARGQEKGQNAIVVQKACPTTSRKGESVQGGVKLPWARGGSGK